MDSLVNHDKFLGDKQTNKQTNKHTHTEIYLFVKDSILKHKKMSFLFISLP